MSDSLNIQLSRRERQIMDTVYRLGEASVAEVVEQLPDKPDYHTIRVTMANLKNKKYLKYRRESKRYLYSPVVPEEKAKRSALGHVLGTFFAGSSSRAILTLLDMSATELSAEELEEIDAWIKKAKNEDLRQGDRDD